MTADPLLIIFLPAALGIIMLGLGLSLSLADFARVVQFPKPVLVGLVCQILLLPVVCFFIAKGFGLAPALAVGLMLLAASPGGTTANLFSHLFRGDVALNISLTAINSVLAAFSIPLITNLAIGYFDVDGELGLQFGKVAQVIALVLVPVVIGMIVRARWEDFAKQADKPVRLFSIIVLVAVTIGAIVGERENVLDYARQVGLVTGLFCLLSLSAGYGLALALRLSRPQAIATSMEVGIHNTTIALTIALSVLDNAMVAIPAAVYSILRYIVAPAFGWAVSRTADVVDDEASDLEPA